MDNDQERPDATRRVLAWDLSRDRRDPSAASAIGWAAIVLFAVSLAASILGWFAIAWNPHRAVIVLLAALAGPIAGLLTVAVLTARGHPQRRRVGLVGIAVVALLPMFLVASLLASTRATPVELRYALQHLRIPGRAEPATLSVTGDRYCRTGPPDAVESFILPSSVANPEAAAVAAIHAQGYALVGGSTVQTATQLSQGPIAVSVNTGDKRNEVRVELSPTATC